jgi:hypothetical protein
MLALSVLFACSESDVPDDALHGIEQSEVARILPPAEALARANVPTLDPAPHVRGGNP